MEHEGLWNLFFATGLPQAYLAARGGAGKETPPEQGAPSGPAQGVSQTQPSTEARTIPERANFN